jgi:hypothetical protein
MPWINGSYQGFSPDTPIVYSVLLRVDLSAVSPRGYVSLDIFRGFLDKDDPDPDTGPGSLDFLESFRSEELGSFAAPPEELSPLVLASVPEGRGTVTLSLRPGDAGPRRHLICRAAGVSFPFPGGDVTFAVTYQSPSFHRLVLDIETQGGFPTPHDVDPDLGLGRPSFHECLSRAGLESVGGRVLRGRIEGKAEWDPRDFAAPPEGPDKGQPFFHTRLLIASAMKDSPGTTGIMFEKRTRSTAAVFYGSLANLFEGGAELDSNFVFTAVHEVAHCLNLPHVFETKHLPSLTGLSNVLSFMNYPHVYTGPKGDLPIAQFPGTNFQGGELIGYKKFWSRFKYEFASAELLELRHGARMGLVTGNDVSPYRGDFSGSTGPLALGGPSGAGLELTLRVRGKDRPGAPSAGERRRLKEAARAGPDRPDPGEADRRSCAVFEFGEPIHVEAQLETRLAKPRELRRRLSPMTGDLQIHYRTPDGQFRPYEPPCLMCYVPEGKVLDDSPGSGTPDAFHKDICLNIGPRGFQLIEPGRYQIRASYRYRDTLLVSNVLQIHVRYPTPEVENLVVPLLDDDVAAYLAFRGVKGLGRATRLLQEAFGDKQSPHPLRNYYYAYEGLRLLADGEEATPTLEEGFKLSGESVSWDAVKDLPFSNITLGKIGKSYCDSLSRSNRRGANNRRKRLRTALAERGVPEAISEAKLEGKVTS